MERRYVVRRDEGGIGFIEIVKETDCFYTLLEANGRTNRREKRRVTSFATFEETRDHYREQTEKTIERLEGKLAEAKARLESIPALDEARATRVPYYYL